MASKYYYFFGYDTTAKAFENVFPVVTLTLNRMIEDETDGPAEELITFPIGTLYFYKRYPEGKLADLLERICASLELQCQVIHGINIEALFNYISDNPEYVENAQFNDLLRWDLRRGNTRSGDLAYARLRTIPIVENRDSDDLHDFSLYVREALVKEFTFKNA